MTLLSVYEILGVPNFCCKKNWTTDTKIIGFFAFYTASNKLCALLATKDYLLCLTTKSRQFAT